MILPIKAVLLNLVSLVAAGGIVVFIFQEGHGSEAIWNVHATDSTSPWIPLMIFAFLFGLSMDYEVFMLTRVREAYEGPFSSDAEINFHGATIATRGTAIGVDVVVDGPVTEAEALQALAASVADSVQQVT